MTISITLNDTEAVLISEYAAKHQLSINDFARNSILQQIEDEQDILAYDEALAEYEANPVTYSLDEVKKELGL